MDEEDEGGSGIVSVRARRRTAKVVNYAKEQEFSDAEDIFEDEADDSPPEPVRRKGRPRKSTSGGGDDSGEVYGGESSRPVYTEKGYDPTLLPIRERFSFLPELEPDGSPRVELIVGRRPISKQVPQDEDPDHEHHEDAGSRFRRGHEQQQSPANKNKDHHGDDVEYEYLVKYKGKSYLHLEWKTGADLESMNKSAKTLYRRWLKKLAAGTEENLEDPDFDPSYAQPQKIVDEAEHEVTVELSDRELLAWEKEREKEMEEEEDNVKPLDGAEEKEEAPEKQKESKEGEDKGKEDDSEEKAKQEKEKLLLELGDDIDFSQLPLDVLRKIVNADGSYYPKVEGSANAYRDGYITEPPKKPRASYLFFQCTMRPYFQRVNPDAGQSELMTILGDTWRSMSDAEQAPFIQLAKEEAEQHDKERALLEKAQKPNQVWQPMRRCQMVLDRLSSDGFSNIFLEPVDMDEFPDYEEIVDQPMDLGTVRQKLQDKKYQMPENFARDMRKIWNNCKVYNQHGSAIWFVADYMSKQFERLYNAWVLEFRDRYLRWANPRARPWEQTCRKCDGKCGTPDDKMVLCDHCDAAYGQSCLKMKRIPKGIWHCPECKPKLKTNKSIRLLSAMSEAAARRKAELGDIPKKKVMKRMFLVKWAGLGYEFCTWETKEDINDDGLIAEFHRLNKMIPDEPDLSEEDVNKVLEEMKHISHANAGGSHCIPDLRVQLYAQSRAFHFSKFAYDLPDSLAAYVGPRTNAFNAQLSRAEDAEDNMEVDEVPPGEPTPVSETKNCDYPLEVLECVHDMTHRVIRGNSQALMKLNGDLPPLLTGEYDAMIPITSKGLMMNVGEIHGSVAFLGYRTFPDGSKGPAEIANIIRNVGDKIIAVDGVSTINKSFKEVILMLRESGNNKFAFMRFLENRFAVCNSDLTSVGNTGRYSVEELANKFATDRRRVLVQRKQNVLDDVEEKNQEDDEDEDAPSDDDEDSEDEGSEGEFEPDSDDDLVISNSKSEEFHEPRLDGSGEIPEGNAVKPEQVGAAQGAVKTEDEAGQLANDKAHQEGHDISDTIILRQETTRSLAYRLLDIDVGYSSDEGGEDDCLCYVDGVDETFTTEKEACPWKEKFSKGKKSKKRQDKDSKEQKLVPMKQNEFSNLGGRAKTNAAITVTSREPDPADFVNFPDPSPKELEAQRKAEEEAKQRAASMDEDAQQHDDSSSPQKTKRSTVKVEQVSVSTGEVIHVWANAETAAATLQISLEDIRRMLKGQYDEDLGDEVGGYRWRYALAGAEVTAKGVGESSRGSKKGKEAYLEFRDKLYDHDEPHSYKNNNRLRDYQIDGVNWLASTWYKRHSCILADEMGLGKTVQIVCYIEHLYRVEKIQRPFLVVVPLSTVEHWRREFEAWTDMVCCVYHDRQRVWRDVMREYEWYFDDRPHTSDFLKFDVLVTTYDTLIGDFDIIGQIPWRVAVVDEAHRLRNIKGKLLECMKEISARGTLQYGFQHRILMTGTPLQNNTQELWTLLNFIEPYNFPSLEEFQANFGNMANQEQVHALQKKISPYMLRRVKEDVAKDIPAKEETVIDVELTSIQKQYYRAIFEHNHAFLSMGASRTNAPKLMNIQMELRKCCNHPFLLEGVEHREMERIFAEFLDTNNLEGKTPEEQQHMMNEHGYVQTSGKMVLLDKLLPKLREEGHKILIFSQMVRMLDLISEYAEFRGFKYERLDGRVRGNERQKAIDRFETENDSFLFLLSTRAGGVGINLTAADICIIFDSDWNPQNDVQAQARCHRIGQTKDVRIYRLVTSRSFEQEMFDRASKKLGLEHAVLGTFNQENEDDKPSSQEMEQLLKKGAYALLEDENDEVTKQFCADDIDAILAKRTRTRVVEGAKTASWLNKQGLVVSKSKFTADITSAEIDIEDPNFWQKVMPDFVTPQIMLDKLDELSVAIEGTKAVKGRGRGRGRRKKQEVAEEKKAEDGDDKKDGENGENSAGLESTEPNGDVDSQQQEKVAENNQKESQTDPDGAEEPNADEDEENNDDDDDDNAKVDGDDGEGEEKAEEKLVISRTNQRKIQKFISDLKSMMDGILEEAEDDSLQSNDKQVCQRLLLTISVKERLFNEEQRHLARSLLKRLEGDRRRRCRTSTDGPGGGSAARLNQSRSSQDKDAGIPEDLLILSKQQRRKRQKKEEEAKGRRRRKGVDGEDLELDEDGYLRHSDDEEEWSDVADDLYGQGKKRATISIKEAQRRRGWAQDDDAATAAGRPWPAIPRHLVKPVLGSLIANVIEYDQSKGGLFSEPVPRDQYPEYYEQIKKPMDYGTMKKKLERGEYRSAQAMQKDFVLVMQNCVKFNDPHSDVVKEARQQTLMRPTVLRNAAKKHNLFLAEDGNVLEIVDDKKDADGSPKKKKKRHKKGDEEEEEGEGGTKKRRRTKRKNEVNDDDDDGDDDDDDMPIASLKRKPRIKISVNGSEGTPKKTTSMKRKKDGDTHETGNETSPGPKKASKKRKKDEDTHEADDETSPGPKKKRSRKASVTPAKKKKKKKGADEEPEIAQDHTVEEAAVDQPSEASEMLDGGRTSRFLDVNLFKEEREGLMDGTFKAARDLFTQHGPWTIPAEVGEERFAEVAKAVIAKMSKLDRYSVFADAVTEEEAPGYYDIVKKPMDFSQMLSKVESGAYGSGSDAAASLFVDFLLIFDNCFLYNDEEGDVVEEATRLFSLLPETYASVCQSLAGKRKNTKEKSSKK